jgi:tRNA(Leu) C34 or U34 (ribose-2'-O)-methylase TrmL
VSFNITDKKEVKAGLKEWKCVLVGHHDNVGKTIEEWEKAGWRLHTYQTAGMGGAMNYTVNHYLLFVRGE